MSIEASLFLLLADVEAGAEKILKVLLFLGRLLLRLGGGGGGRGRLRGRGFLGISMTHAGLPDSRVEKGRRNDVAGHGGAYLGRVGVIAFETREAFLGRGGLLVVFGLDVKVKAAQFLRWGRRDVLRWM